MELPNVTKREIVGIDVLKSVQVAVYGMRHIDPNHDTLKIFGIYFTNNEKLKKQNFLYNCNKYSMSIENLEMRNLLLEGKIIVFKRILKIIFQSFITTFLRYVVSEIEKYKPFFIGKIYD